ncbi:MAG: endonuclease V [Methanomicrobiales archaeon]|nr:endonuclease V [Methanomicrobiales archaeon]
MPVTSDPRLLPVIRRAIAAQERLRQRCIREKALIADPLRTVGGVDVSYDEKRAFAAAVVLGFPDLEPCCHAGAVKKAVFPYIPGLLAFREAPPVLAAMRSLAVMPDLLFVNGHGYAHPRRFGLASHVGVLLDIPAVGIARRPLIGTAGNPANESGAHAPILDHDDVIGMAVRSSIHCRPVCVSAGHRVDLATAVMVTLAATVPGRRLPEPLRIADALSKKMRRDSTK